MPRTRHPDAFSEDVKLALDQALHAEVLIPFQNPRLLREFRASFYELCRAHREHKTPLAPRIAQNSARMYTTVDVQNTRANWDPGPQYPFTLVLDCRRRFEANVANMGLVTDTPDAPPIISPKAPPSRHDHFAREIEEPHTITEDPDDNTFADILNRLDNT